METGAHTNGGDWETKANPCNSFFKTGAPTGISVLMLIQEKFKEDFIEC